MHTKRLLGIALENGFDIKIVWIPGHAGIRGNELVDKLAKIGRSLNVPKDIEIDASEYLPHIKFKIINEFTNEWSVSLNTKGRFYAQICSSFLKNRWFSCLDFVNRRHLTSIIRMRTGHCMTAVHLFRLGIKDSPDCECGSVQDLNHIFFECQNNRAHGFCLYEELCRVGVFAPMGVKTLLIEPNFQIIRLINKFLTMNRIII